MSDECMIEIETLLWGLPRSVNSDTDTTDCPVQKLRESS